MAKKTAAKKKAAPAKAKPAAKSSKPTKPAKAEKPAAKAASAKTAKAEKAPVALKAVKAVPAKAEAKASKPSLMTKKGKGAEEAVEPAEPKKNTSIVAMLESEAPATDPAKVEKTSKVKPVKVDRGNVNDEKAKWTELFKKYGKEKAVTYKMSESYQSLIPLQHKVLGWGFVLTNDNDRLEVLFENGIRMLISNYKS